ncbi:EamA family transporter [Sphingomonas soli]|uniref:EamA family transporter n=1 Tax=Sphingomonas soli TaxID=266127 RepID=UPI000ABAB262|nr:EamA family transporter [Sphingomonas soli]
MPLPHVAAGVVVVAIWGSNFVVARMALEQFPPITFSVLRFAVASLPLIWLIRPPRMPVREIVAYGLLIGVGQFGLLLYALDGHMSAGLASLLIQTQAIFTVALALVIGGERPRADNLVALALCITGIALIGLDAGGAADPLGIVLVLGAALGWAGGNILAKRAGNIDMLALMVWSGLAAVPPLLAAALLIEGSELMMRSLAQADAFAWATVPWQSFANSLFCYSVWNWLLARHPAADVAPIGLLVPVFGMSAAAWLLAEPMPTWKVAAAILVLTGLAVNFWTSRRAAQPKTPNEIEPMEVMS